MSLKQTSFLDDSDDAGGSRTDGREGNLHRLRCALKTVACSHIVNSFSLLNTRPLISCGVGRS